MTHEHPMPGTTSPRRVQPPVQLLRFVVGTWEPHDVEVRYGATLRVLSIRIDGRTVYRHWGRAPFASRRAKEFKTPGREAHTFIVEPPGALRTRDTDPNSYLIWLDGQVIARVDHD
jgi:hypothetical protein